LCLLITEAPEAAASRERLDAVAATSDGFELARLDVEQRSEGDVLGSAQSGRRRHLKLLSLLHDEQLIAEARDEATIIVTADPQLELHPNLAALVSDLVADDQADFLEKG
jgi:ATP-dependent DNA helicase RecG